MDKLETARFVKLVAGTWPDIKLTEDTIKAWSYILKNEDFKLASAAVLSLVNSKPDSYTPKIQDFIREMKKLVCPKLFLSYEEAEMRGSAILRRAKDQVYGKPKEYNPYGNPKEKEYSAYQAQAQERAVKATYESLRSSLEQRPVIELKLISQGKKACIEAGRDDLVELFSSAGQRQAVLPQSILQRIEEGQNG